MMMARHAMATRSAGGSTSNPNSAANSGASAPSGTVAVADAVAVASSTASAAAEAAAAAAAAAAVASPAAPGCTVSPPAAVGAPSSPHSALSTPSALPLSSPADAASVVAPRHRGGIGLRSSSLLAMVTSANSALPASAPVAASLAAVPGASVTALRSHKPLGRPHSSKFGTVNYSTDEMRRLVEKVRAVMPVSTEDWLHVAYQFNYMRPESIPYREVESLKRKFKKMYCSRASGNSKLPDYVVEAKELRRLINQRTDVSAASTAAAPSLVDTAAAALEEATSSSSSHKTDGASQTTAGCGDGDTNAEDGGRDLSARLTAMEDEYNTPSPAVSRRSMASSVTVGASGTWSTAPSMAVDSTNGIINLLRHSIERKRRTVEEQLLSESERVRKERKKRKMEQALYNIHREHEMMASSTAPAPVGAPPSMESSPSTVDPAFASLPSTSAATPPPAFSSLLGPIAYAPSALQTDASSLGVMEVLLQFMLVQQQENTRRWQELEERRRRAEAVARRRRRADARRRRRDKHELMALMARLFQGDFPEALKKYVDPAYVDESSDELGDGEDDDDGDATSDSDNRAPPAGDSSATASAAASSATNAGVRLADQAATASMNIATDVVL